MDDILELFGDAPVDINCASCGKNFEVEFEILAVDGTVYNCPHCDQEYLSVLTDETVDTLANADKATKDFLKHFK